VGSVGFERAIRGGSFLDDPEFLRVSSRSYYSPVLRFSSLGFRCARDAGEERVVRGGSFDIPQNYLRSARRDIAMPVSRGDNLGFRCARDIAEAQFPPFNLDVPPSPAQQPPISAGPGRWVKGSGTAVLLDGILTVHATGGSVMIWRKGGQLHTLFFGTGADAPARAVDFAKRLVEALPE